MRTAAELRERKMNELEARFASDYLGLLQLGGELQWYEFEPWRLRLGGSAFYRPDFGALDSVGQIINYETKGHWREAARARIKIAAARFPMMRFFAVQWDRKGGGWVFEEFGP